MRCRQRPNKRLPILLPSPLAGEGLGERGVPRQTADASQKLIGQEVGASAIRARRLTARLHPLPNPSPVEGEGLSEHLSRSAPQPATQRPSSRRRAWPGLAVSAAHRVWNCSGRVLGQFCLVPLATGTMPGWASPRAMAISLLSGRIGPGRRRPGCLAVSTVAISSRRCPGGPRARGRTGAARAGRRVWRGLRRGRLASPRGA